MGAARVKRVTSNKRDVAIHVLRSRTSARKAILPGLSEESSSADPSVVIPLVDL